MRMYSIGFAFCGDEVVLVTKAKPDWQLGKLNGVGGSVNPGENFIEAMVREFKEETGHQTKEADWRTCLTLYNEGFQMVVFKMESTGAFPVRGTLEEPAGWYRLSYVLGPNANKIDNLQWIIPMLRDKFIKFPVPAIEY